MGYSNEDLKRMRKSFGIDPGPGEDRGYLEPSDKEKIKLEPKFAKRLMLNNRGYTEMPDLGQYVELEILFLSGNEINELNNLESLRNLKEFYIANNELESLDGVEVLENLEVIDVSNNYLGDIRELKALKKLKKIYANSNEIKNTDGLEDLKDLKLVELYHNPIYSGETAKLKDNGVKVNITIHMR